MTSWCRVKIYIRTVSHIHAWRHACIYKRLHFAANSPRACASEVLNIPETLARVHEFDDSTQAFISTLLVALAEWIAPAAAITETDFVCRLVTPALPESRPHQSSFDLIR